METEERMLGRTAYQAYSEASGGKSLVSGAALPQWDDVPAMIQTAWIAAAQAVKATLAGDV